MEHEHAALVDEAEVVQLEGAAQAGVGDEPGVELEREAALAGGQRGRRLADGDRLELAVAVVAVEHGADGVAAGAGDLERELVWDSHLRAELMFTHRGDEHFSLGPSLELRGADLDTFEVAAGLSVLLPVARGYPIQVSAQAGYAVRHGQRHGGSAPIFVGTIAGGYRSFNFHHWWQTSLQIYAQVRMDITEPRNLQFMMGVEFDLAQAMVVPALMIRMKVRGGDPEELDEDGDGIPDAEEDEQGDSED